MSDAKKPTPEKSKYPVNLLDTPFPMRGDLPKREPAWVAEVLRSNFSRERLCQVSQFWRTDERSSQAAYGWQLENESQPY